MKRVEAETGLTREEVLAVPGIGGHLRLSKVGRNEAYQVSQEGLAILKGVEEAANQAPRMVRILQRPINKRLLVVDMEGSREKVFVRDNRNFSVGNQIEVEWRDRWEPTARYRERVTKALA
jgi:hypothetical protein